MKPYTALLLLLLTFCVCPPVLAVTTDAQAEARISRELGDLPNTEMKTLQAAGQAFPALFSPAASPQLKGAVILVHGMGQHLNWPQVIRPLREQLPQHGWATLSLQMPILPVNLDQAEYGKTLQLASQRIQAGYDFLAGENLLNTVIVGQGLGAASVMRHIAGQQETAVVAVAGISMPSGQWLSPALDLIEDLGKISIPVLDLYASNDNTAVLQAIEERKTMLQAVQESQYRTIIIPGAGPHYSGFEKQLVKRVRSWLSVVAPSSEVAIEEPK